MRSPTDHARRHRAVPCREGPPGRAGQGRSADSVRTCSPPSRPTRSFAGRWPGCWAPQPSTPPTARASDCPLFRRCNSPRPATVTTPGQLLRDSSSASPERRRRSRRIMPSWHVATTPWPWALTRARIAERGARGALGGRRAATAPRDRGPADTAGQPGPHKDVAELRPADRPPGTLTRENRSPERGSAARPASQKSPGRAATRAGPDQGIPPQHMPPPPDSREQFGSQAPHRGIALRRRPDDRGPGHAADLLRLRPDQRTRLTVSARASVRCRRRPRGARR